MKAKNNPRYHNSYIARSSRCVIFLGMYINLLGLFLTTQLHATPLESFLLFYSNNIQGEIEPCG
jgi:hypothetical protein